MPTWPATLPQRPLVNGFSETPQSNVIRSSMATGPAKQRRRFTAKIINYDMVFHMTAAQKATLDTFYETTLSDGITPFDFTHPISGATVSLRFMEDPPSYRAVAPTLFAVTIKVEQLP